jgi:hypothetical protein
MSLSSTSSTEENILCKALLTLEVSPRVLLEEFLFSLLASRVDVERASVAGGGYPAVFLTFAIISRCAILGSRECCVTSSQAGYGGSDTHSSVRTEYSRSSCEHRSVHKSTEET